MYRYSNNAFRVLGLKPDASLPEIKKRVNEIKVKTSLGGDIRYEYDFPFLGLINREEENILNALQRLEDPITRLKEEIFWFWIETDDDKEAIDCLIKGDITGARNIWNRKLQDDDVTEKNISAYINQIILAHGIAIAGEIRIINNEKLDINNKWKGNWKAIINSLILLNNNDSFWDSIYRKAERISDPRLTPDKIDKIKESFLSDILQPNFMFISQALNKKEYQIVKSQVGVFYSDNDWVPGESYVPKKILREGFNKILSHHTELLDEYSHYAKTEYIKIVKNNKDLGKLVSSITDFYSKYIEDTELIVYEGNLVDSYNLSDFAFAKDKGSEIIWACSSLLFSNLADDKTYKGRKRVLFKSYIMIERAIEYSGTDYSLRNITEDMYNMRKYLCHTFYYNNDQFYEICNTVKEDEKNPLITNETDIKENPYTRYKDYILILFLIIFLIMIGSC